MPSEILTYVLVAMILVALPCLAIVMRRRAQTRTKTVFLNATLPHPEPQAIADIRAEAERSWNGARDPRSAALDEAPGSRTRALPVIRD